ncbi:MAG: DUF4113 domain-containing protein [Muribaculaceae bacterium]
MQILDSINTSQNMHDTIHVATHAPMSQIVKQVARSPLYTTRFDEILIIK